MKNTILSLSVLFMVSCGDAATDAPACNVQPLRSTYIIDCGGGYGVCRDAQGAIMYQDCELPNGNDSVHCVASCD